MKKEDFEIKLEQHDTKDVSDGHVNGSLTVVWRDWDKIIKNNPKMVYVSSVNPNEIKGPHLHKKRNSYFLCIEGKVIFVIKNGNEYFEIESGETNPVMVFVPNGIASAHINIAKTTSKVLALADIAWRPDDNEMENVPFEDYEWKKWN
jgi:dTDP-4-dehydrorhamnose 3,5-epimerase|tara:strand:+ start:12868 stop:13311 length:444 start_codon:yes stop_codon:yes gene_type:complete